MTFDVNYLAIVLAAIAQIVIGMPWYGETLFGKIWMEETGMNKEKTNAIMKKNGPVIMIGAFLGSFVMAFVLTQVMREFGTESWTGAVSAAFWIWLGFYATTHLSPVLWEGKGMRLWLVHATYALVSLVASALIIFAFV